jgi:hypothetical protein
MASARLLKFLAGSELGLLSTVLFAGLYTWPFLTFARPSATFRFIFAAWMLHIALIAVTSFARKRLEDGAASESDEG